MTNSDTPQRDPRPPLHASYTRAWLAVLLAFLITEAAALARGKPGGTLSEHVLRLQDRASWEGALIMMVWGWLGVHFTRVTPRPLGWIDLAAVLAGLAVWYVAVYLRVRGGA